MTSAWPEWLFKRGECEGNCAGNEESGLTFGSNDPQGNDVNQLGDTILTPLSATDPDSLSTGVYKIISSVAA